MFAVDIAIESYYGVKLHKRDGTEYWKLRLTCTLEACPNEVEMGECLCFGNEDDMIKARENHGMYCGTQCWVDDHDKETVAKAVARARREIKDWDSEERGLFIDDFKDDIQVLDGFWRYEAEAGAYDGEEFYEEFDVQDCPI